jgi:uncharacterized membrane protein
MGINWAVALNWVPTSANIVACIAVAWILWLEYGRVQSGVRKAWVTIGAAMVGFILYFLVQALLEEGFPQTRINGDVVVYNIDFFAVALIVVIAAVFVLRKAVTPGGVSRA